MRPPSNGGHNHHNPRRLLFALASSFLLPFNAVAQQVPQQPRDDGRSAVQSSSTSTSPYEDQGAASYYNTERDAYRRRNGEGIMSRRPDEDNKIMVPEANIAVGKKAMKRSNSQLDEDRKPSTFAPASAVRAPADRNIQPLALVFADGAGLLSLQHPARSLDDWEVEDFVLLASVDGTLTAAERRTGKTIWTINTDRPMVETTHYPPHINASDNPDSPYDDPFSVYKWVWSVEPRGDGNIYIWSPNAEGTTGRLGGLHPTQFSMRGIVEKMSPIYRQGDPPLLYRGSKTSDMVVIDASTGRVVHLLSDDSGDYHNTDNDSCKYQSQFDSTECNSRGLFSLERTHYTVRIVDKNTKRPVAKLVYSEWAVNDFDYDLLNQVSDTQDGHFISGRHDGLVYGFDHGRSESEPLFRRVLSSPLASVLEVYRPLYPTNPQEELVVLPQPMPIPNDSDMIYNRQNYVFINQTDGGGWYAMPGQSYPLVLAAPRAPINEPDIWAAQPQKLLESENKRSKLLAGTHMVRPLEGSDRFTNLPTLPSPDNGEKAGSGVEDYGDDFGPSDLNMDKDLALAKQDGFTLMLNSILLFIKFCLQSIWDFIRNPLAILVILYYALTMTQNPIRDVAVKHGVLSPFSSASKIVEDVSQSVGGVNKEVDVAEAADDQTPSTLLETKEETSAITVTDEVGEVVAADAARDKVNLGREAKEIELRPEPSAAEGKQWLEPGILKTESATPEVELGKITEAAASKTEHQPQVPNQASLELRGDHGLAVDRRATTKGTESPVDRKEVTFANGDAEAPAPASIPDSPEQPAKKKTRRGKRGGVKHKKGPKQRDTSQSRGDDVVLSVDQVVAKAIGGEAKAPQPQPDVETVDGRPEEVSGSILKLNNLEVNEQEQLGTGSNGTVVFSGRFDGRDVAVKRMLIQFYDIASQETKLLRESDDHPNVIRYYSQVQTGPFLYIALELCKASLADIIERPLGYRELALAGQQNIQYVLCQVTEGLRFLHDLRIVHRDLKPHNILVNIDRDSLPRLVVSDFGLCKKLEGGQSSFGATTAHAAGTSGWRAPELLVDDDNNSNPNAMESVHSGNSLVSTDGLPTNRRVTRAIDIFSLGLVYFYVLTGGQHPFDCGDRYMREVNIRNGKYNLDALEALGDDGQEAQQLIGSMLQSNHKLRPTARDVLAHPFFWPNKKKLLFLTNISDHFEKEIREPPSPALVCLESISQRVISSHDFLKQLPQAFVDSLGKQRKYTGSRMLDLLRAIRNKHNHYEDMSDGLKKTVGSLPGGYLRFWTTRFPNMLIACWQLIFDLQLEDSERFKEYYKPCKPDASLWR
ncbi:putative Serine/threonine kinase IRE1 [Zalerion maritima]|uniref:non-specific serine/threonine protein kinase n=1 Tax=Zalerion maritima TaxID=339359 RepID=A0AAD5RP42_9PEZI|nr:putative Serine/threonine kinase IRE1 [Zalerion maritima]